MLMREAIRADEGGHQRPSKLMREAIRADEGGHQRPSEAIHRNQ